MNRNEGMNLRRLKYFVKIVDIGSLTQAADVLHIAQLHGQEDEAYLTALRRLTDKPIWQAFQIRSAADVRRAAASTADFILLDAGAGGGAVFDWTLLAGLDRPFALAGGLNADNVERAVLAVRPAGVDAHTGLEDTAGGKDEALVRRFVAGARRAFASPAGAGLAKDCESK